MYYSFIEIPVTNNDNMISFTMNSKAKIQKRQMMNGLYGLNKAMKMESKMENPNIFFCLLHIGHNFIKHISIKQRC